MRVCDVLLSPISRSLLLGILSRFFGVWGSVYKLEKTVPKLRGFLPPAWYIAMRRVALMQPGEPLLGDVPTLLEIDLVSQKLYLPLPSLSLSLSKLMARNRKWWAARRKESLTDHQYICGRPKYWQLISVISVKPKCPPLRRDMSDVLALSISSVHAELSRWSFILLFNAGLYDRRAIWLWQLLTVRAKICE